MFAPIVVSQLCTQRVDEHGFICLSAHERRTLFGAETRRCDSGLHRVSRGKSPGSRYWQWNCELRTSEPEPAPTDATTQKRGSESQKQPESIWACPRMTFAKPDTVTHVGRLCPKHDGPDTGTLSAIEHPHTSPHSPLGTQGIRRGAHSEQPHSPGNAAQHRASHFRRRR